MESNAGGLDPQWLDMSTYDLYWEARRISVAKSREDGHIGAITEFGQTFDEIYDIDRATKLGEVVIIGGFLILSCVPVLGTAIDVIDGVRSLMMGDLVGFGLNLLGPLGDAVGKMRLLQRAGDTASGVLRGANRAAAEAVDNVRAALAKLDEGILDDLDLRANQLDEGVKELRGRVRSASRSGPNTGVSLRNRREWNASRPMPNTPPPGIHGNISIYTQSELSDAGLIPWKPKGSTRSGTAIQKHTGAGRPRISDWDNLAIQVTGSPVPNSGFGLIPARNISGQMMLDYIIEQPDTMWSYNNVRGWRSVTGHGEILEARLPNGLGARWSIYPDPRLPSRYSFNFVGFVD